MTSSLTKTVRFGTASTCGGRYMSVFAKIRYTDGRLSISGVEGPLPSGNALGSCGQIDKPQIENYAPGWNPKKLRRFFAIWERWHLNDMRPGCEHQRALGWDIGSLMQSCPVCCYAYGSAWLSEEVPADILAELAALPDADTTPAWV